MQRSRFDPNDPGYDGGDVPPTAMPPISDPNHPDHAAWAAEYVNGPDDTPAPAQAETGEPEKPKRERKPAAKAKASAKKAAPATAKASKR